MADCFIMKKGEGFDYGVNFKKENLVNGLGLQSGFLRKIEGAKTFITAPGNVDSRWTPLAYISAKRDKMYKLVIKDYIGYGRFGLSAIGATYPQVSSNKNAFGMFGGEGTFDNLANSAPSTGTNISYYYAGVQSDRSEGECSLWWCTDFNRNGSIGTNSFTFEMYLYEQEDI